MGYAHCLIAAAAAHACAEVDGSACGGGGEKGEAGGGGGGRVGLVAVGVGGVAV